MGSGVGGDPRLPRRRHRGARGLGRPGSAYPSPLVDIRLVRNRAVLAANATALLTGIGMFGVLSLVNLYTQVPSGSGYGFDLSLTATGLVLLPISLGSLTANRAASALVSRFGPYKVLPVGSLVVTADLLMLALWRDHVAISPSAPFCWGRAWGRRTR